MMIDDENNHNDDDDDDDNNNNNNNNTLPKWVPLSHTDALVNVLSSTLENIHLKKI
jgi:hypothetical protein